MITVNTPPTIGKDNVLGAFASLKLVEQTGVFMTLTVNIDFITSIDLLSTETLVLGSSPTDVIKNVFYLLLQCDSKVEKGERMNESYQRQLRSLWDQLFQFIKR